MPGKSEDSVSPPVAGGAPRRSPTIRVRLLLTVNAVMLVLLTVLLVTDYRYQLASRLAEKHRSLQEEAEVLLPTVDAIGSDRPKAVQRLIDRACSQMRETSSPGHHIAVALADQTIQARAHHRASDGYVQAMQHAAADPGGRARIADEMIVVGAAQHGAITVYVSEYVSDIYTSARRQLLVRLAAIAGLGVLAAAMVNIVLVRLVTHPLKRLVTTVRHIGRGELGKQSSAFGTAEMDYLASEINTMSRSLARAEEGRRYQLQKAQRIQHHLRPREVNADGLVAAIAADSASEVAGDFHDLLRLDDGSWLIAIADVTGHGIPAAMGAAVLKALLAAAAEHKRDPASIMAHMNARFCNVTLDEDFASVFLIRWQPDTRTLTYAGAGHEPAYLLRSEVPIALESDGTLLGIDPAATWRSTSLQLQPGDRIVLYTDGLTESRTREGVLFGRQRLLDLLHTVSDINADELIRTIRRTVEDHRATAPPHDDMTLVVLEATERESETEPHFSSASPTSHIAAVSD